MWENPFVPKTFRVEQVLAFPARTVHIILTAGVGRALAISESSTLAGAPIHKWLDQPRRVREDGTLDLDIFAVALQNAADRSRFLVGNAVVLLS